MAWLAADAGMLVPHPVLGIPRAFFNLAKGLAEIRPPFLALIGAIERVWAKWRIRYCGVWSWRR